MAGNEDPYWWLEFIDYPSSDDETPADAVWFPATVPNNVAPVPVASANCTCLLLSSPHIIREWHDQGKSLQDIRYLQQYFVQVAQVYGEKTVNAILQQRHQPTPHDLDPRRMFPINSGIPFFGYVLPHTATPLTWQTSSDPKPPRNTTTIFTAYLRASEPLPIGTTILDMLHSYPNHLVGEHLDALIQHELGGSGVWQTVPQHIKDELEPAGDNKTVNHQMVSQRMRRRTKQISDMYETNHVLDFQQSKFKLREVGTELPKGIRGNAVKPNGLRVESGRGSGQQGEIMPCLLFGKPEDCPQHGQLPGHDDRSLYGP